MKDGDNNHNGGRKVYRFVRKFGEHSAEKKKKDNVIDLLSEYGIESEGKVEEIEKRNRIISDIKYARKSKKKNEIEMGGHSDRNIVSEKDDSEGDIDLLLIFGMEEEAKRQNPTKYGELKGNIEKHKIIKNRMEYIERSQNNEMTKKYRSEQRACITKLILSVAILMICALFEYYVFFQKSIVARFIIYYNPALVGLCALQMLLFIAALSYKRFFRGFGFFAGRADINSFFSLTAILLFVYYIFLIITPDAVANDGSFVYNLYLTPFAFVGLTGSIYDLIKCICELRTFNVISGEEEKTALESFGRGSAKELFRSSKGNRALAVRSCDFVMSFVTRTRYKLSDRTLIYTLSLISLFFSIGIGVYKYFIDHSYGTSFSYAIFSLFMTMPLSMYLIYSLIPGVTVISQAKKRSAIIGDKTFEEYSDACALYFDDNTIFKPSHVKLKGFNIYEDNKMDDSLYIIASVYSKIGSPAAKLFTDSIPGEVSKNVDIIDVSKNGLHASVDGRSVYLGSAGYIGGCGYNIHNGENESSPFEILYMAVDHKTAIKVYLEYRIDKNAADLVLALKKQGKYLGVFTCDPCINEKMIEKELGSGKFPIGIIRVNADNKADKLESGIVTLRGVDGILDSLYRTVKTYGIWKIDSGLRFFVTASGAFISLLFAVFADPGELGLLYTLAVLLLGSIPTLLFSLFLRKK